MTTSSSPATKTRGRPRDFDRDAVLNEAMKLFWDRGYEGTSFDQLVAATGLSISSLYNAFGNKERLYEEVVRYYVEGPGLFFMRALSQSGSTRDAFRKLLKDTCLAFTASPESGCMISLAGLHMAPAHEAVRTAMREQRRISEAALRTRIERGITEGDMPTDTDAAGLASFVDAIIRGMAVKARDGASKKTLLAIAGRTMRGWDALAAAV